MLGVVDQPPQYSQLLTNSPYYVIPELDRLHRARRGCENRIKSLKHAGLGKLPYWSFAANQSWALLAGTAVNLLAWVQWWCCRPGTRPRCGT